MVNFESEDEQQNAFCRDKGAHGLAVGQLTSVTIETRFFMIINISVLNIKLSRVKKFLFRGVILDG